jgi:hypothetical protein
MAKELLPRWHHLYVWAFETSCLLGLDGDIRLAALHRWKSGALQQLVWFYDGALEIADPQRVDWAEFPELDAARAASFFAPPSAAGMR